MLNTSLAGRNTPAGAPQAQALCRARKGSSDPTPNARRTDPGPGTSSWWRRGAPASPTGAQGAEIRNKRGFCGGRWTCGAERESGALLSIGGIDMSEYDWRTMARAMGAGDRAADDVATTGLRVLRWTRRSVARRALRAAHRAVSSVRSRRRPARSRASPALIPGMFVCVARFSRARGAAARLSAAIPPRVPT